MATSRPFAYNTGSTINGTEQVGSIAIGYPTSGFTSTGLRWWNGPDEDLGYVIAHTVPSGTQPTPVPDDTLFLSTTYKGGDISLSNNNQTASQLFGYQQSVLGETIISGSNKVMFSVLCNLLEPNVLIGSHVIGVGLTSMNYQGNPYGGYPGNDTNSIGFSDDGKYYFNGNIVQSGLPTWTDGDIIDIAIASGQYWWIRVNGGDWNNDPSANPTTGSGGSLLNGIINPYPVLCPSYQGIMTVLNYPKYEVPSEFNFLGNVSASIGFWRTSSKTDNNFISLSQYVSSFTGTPQTFASAPAAKTWLNSAGYWTSWVLSYTAGVFKTTYSGYFNDNVSFFATATPASVGGNPAFSVQTTEITEPPTGDGENFSCQWLGYFKPTTSETYTFYTSSDDASYVWIGNNTISGFTTTNSTVNNGGLHGTTERSGTATLVADTYYPLRVQFGELSGGDVMTFSYSTPTIAKTTNVTGLIFYNLATSGF
jgi:hypothetical protein